MIAVRCKPVKKVFPPQKEDELSFSVCVYKAESLEELPDSAKGLSFKATGHLLPCCPYSQVILYGTRWETKDGDLVLSVEDYEEEVPAGRIPAAAFLETLDGCEKAEANRIVNTVNGNRVLETLDHADDLFEKALKNKVLAKRVSNAFKLRRTHRQILFYLMNKLPPRDLDIAVENALIATSIDEVKQNPFELSVKGTLPYSVAKKIAKENGVNQNSLLAAESAIIDSLKQAEGQSSSVDSDSIVGNTYCEVSELVEKAANKLGFLKEDPILIQAINNLLAKSVCKCAEGKYIYRKETCEAEYGIAREIIRLNSAEIPQLEYREDIYDLEDEKCMRLAPEQRKGVKAALLNPVTLLIGGPGTGKTTIEQFIIEVYRRYNPDRPILLIAPTGKAARRMSEATGEAACTGHKALGVSAGTEVIVTDKMLDAGLILIDEASMVDSQLGYALFKAIPTGTQVVIVGDTNQLPSVGAGNVLFELIASGVIATVELEEVYRQKAGSTIAVNCARIKRGKTQLDYTEDFQFIPVTSQEEAVQTILDCYDKELARGLTSEDICILSPFRRSTPTGVNALNPLIQKKLIKPGTQAISYGQKTFYLGDKVMIMANRGDAANGDVGYIREINGNKFTVDFGDERKIQYKKADLRDFELAYGISIHKSQGSEYKTCIIVLCDEHKAMLKRNLVYTAVSRAKQRVIIVGTLSALELSIVQEDSTRRRSRLATIMKKISYEPTPS